MTRSSNCAGILSVLLADSNRMQSRLLANALQRRPEFRISISPIEINSIRQAIILARAKVLLISSNASASTEALMTTMHQVHLAYPDVAKILLTESYDRELVISAFRSGAQGIFCLSNTHFRLLCRCIQRVAEGQVWANSEQTRFLLDLISDVPSIRVLDSKGWQLLTPREEQVVALVAEGLSNSEVARDLKLSVHTVKKYLFGIFDKLGVSSRVELVLHAVNHCDRREVDWVATRAAARTDRLQI
jgi:DNA-binding NarL/FixJ family response regulator